MAEGINFISVIMVDGGFREKFHLIDYLNRQTLPRDMYELIWVEFFDDVNSCLASKPGVEIVTLGHSKDHPYHSSYCFNEGIRRSRGELVVIIDADQVVEPDFLEAILREHRETDRLVMYVMRWDEPKEEHIEPVDLEHLRRVTRIKNPVNYGGCLTVRKKWLYEINGYDLDPIFEGLHANGRDLWTRFKNLGLYVMWHPTQRMYHPWHPNTLYSANSTYDEQLKHISWKAKNLIVKANEGIGVFDNERFMENPAVEFPEMVIR